jgi:hypothetical protein
MSRRKRKFLNFNLQNLPKNWIQNLIVLKTFKIQIVSELFDYYHAAVNQKQAQNGSLLVSFATVNLKRKAKNENIFWMNF